MKELTCKGLGTALYRLRDERDMSKKEVLAAVERDYGKCDESTLRRYENGVMRPPKKFLLSMLTRAFGILDSSRVSRILRLAEYVLTSDDIRRYGLSVTPAEPQKILWGPSNGMRPGICVMNSATNEFIPWNELELEIETGLLNQLGRHIPARCTAALDSFENRIAWLVRIVDPDGKNVGDIWFGNNPDNHWSYDGLVRAGIAHTKYVAEVWQVFQRHSDGSYRRIRAN